MKRFLVFGGDNYYPRGGWDDFQGDFEFIDLAISAILNPTGARSWYDWAHIVSYGAIIRSFVDGKEVTDGPSEMFR